MQYQCNISVNAYSREEYRKQLINIFLQEEPGNSESKSEYRYNVTTLPNKVIVYLKRPTSLNKGMDFEIRFDGGNFRYGKYNNIISTGNRPSHGDLFNDLQSKKEESLTEFQRLKQIVDKICNCQNIPSEEYPNYTFTKGYSVELVMTALKWLFIEQDITYWNGRGREMLYTGLSGLW